MRADWPPAPAPVLPTRALDLPPESIDRARPPRRTPCRAWRRPPPASVRDARSTAVRPRLTHALQSERSPRAPESPPLRAALILSNPLALRLVVSAPNLIEIHRR